MRKRALRLLLLGPKSYFWEHAARSTYTQSNPSMLAACTSGAAGELATSSTVGIYPAAPLLCRVPVATPQLDPSRPPPFPHQRQSATTSPATPPHDSSLESSPLATSTIINPTKAIRHLKPSSATSYDSAKKCRTFSSGMAPPSCSPVPGDSAPVTATTTVSAPAEALAAPRAATTAGSVAAKSGGRHPSTVKQSRSTGHYRGGGASLADEPTEPLPLPQSSQCAVAVGTRNPHQHRDVRYAATAPPPDLNRSSSRWGAGAWGVVGSRARGRAHGIAAAPAALGASVITEFSSRARPPAEFRTHRSSSSSRPATLAAPPDRASDQRLRDQHHQHPVGDILATMRQAGQSRNLQLRRRAAASLVAWVNRQWRAPEPADAATTVATLPAAAAVELAVLCSDLSLTDTAVWDMLLRRVAAEAAVPAAEVEAAATAGVVLHERFVVAEGSGAYGLPPTLRGTRGSAGPVEPHDQRRAALVQVWEVALVMHAAAACGHAAHPLLVELQHALSTLTRSSLRTPTLRGPCSSSNSGDGIGSNGSSSSSASGGDRLVGKGVAGCGGGEEVMVAQGGAAGVGHSQHLDGEGAPRLAALLYAAGELSPPMTLTPPPERPTGHRDMRHYERHSAVEMGAWAETVLGEPGAVEAALRELLAVVRQTQPYGVGGVLGHSAVGAASSLRTMLFGWRRMLLSLQGGSIQGKPAAVATPSAMPPAVATSAATATAEDVAAAAAAPPIAGLSEELLQYLACFVRSRTDQLLPEARGDNSRDSGSSSSSGGGGSGDSRAVQQLSVAWSSAPDLHRHGRLSRAVWDALPFTAALVEPNVPWVGAACAVEPPDPWVPGSGPLSAAAAAVPPNAAAAALLSDICRLAAATFYTPTDYWANELAASPGSCSTNGGRSRRRVSSNNSNRRTNSSYSPHANDLLLLVRAMEVLRGQSATATATAIAAAGSGRQLLALAAGGPGLSLPSTTTATLESIVLASASAHLRRVTGQLAAEGRQPGIDGRCGGGSDETGSDVLDLPVSARLTEYLARRSRIPDWHLIWRLVRHQNAAAELVPQPWRMQQGDDGGGEAAAWPVRGAAAAAERVLRSDAEDLQRWCWPRTAVRLAEALAESTWLGSAETTGADATGDCDAAAAAGAAAIAAAAEKLLLHAAPAAVTGTRSDDLAATLAWLRSAAVLEGGRRRHRHSPQRGGGDGGNGVLPAAIASVAAHAESQLLLLLLKQEHHHQPEAQRWPRRQQAASTAPATSVAAATASRELSSVFDLDADTTSGSCCGIASSSSSSGGDGVSTGSGDLELPALPGGSQGGDATELAGVIEAVGSLLAADTRLGELQESGLPASLMVACLQVLAASAASAASASAASSAAVEWLPAMDFPCVGSPPGGPGGALGAGSNAVGGGGGSGGGCIRGAVLRNAAAQALDWLATRRRYVPVGTTHTSLLPLLTAVTTSPPPPPPPPPRPPLREPTAPPPATNTHVGAGAAEGDSGVGGNGGTGLSVSAVKRFTSRQYGQQPHHHVATALLAVSRLIADEEAAAAAEEEEGEGEDGADPEMRSMRLHQLQAAARQLAEDLRRAPSERLPLPQLADLCTSLRELGLMDAQLLLHLTQQHRERRQQQGNMWNSRPYAAAAAAAGGAGCAAVAAAQLLSLAAAVLCSTAAAAAPPAAGSSSPISARVRAAAAAAAASAPLTRSQLADAAAARVVWLAPVLMSRRDGLEAVPPEMLVAACCAVHDLGAAAGGGGGGAVQWYGSADTCLAELGSVVTRRLLETGVDGLLLHQLAALSRCLAQLPAARGAPGNRSQEGPRDRTRDRDPGQAIQAGAVGPSAAKPIPDNEATRVATAAATAASSSSSSSSSAAAAEAAVVQGGERQSGGGWLPRWWSWRPPLERPAQADSGECPDRREGRDSRSGLSRLVGGGGDGGSGGGGGVNTTGEAAAGAMPQGLAALGTGGRGLDESRSDVELRERVQEALLCRTTRRGDAYEAPTDVACRALRDLAVAGTLRTLPTLAASLVDGLVFRLAEDAGVDDLAAVAAALAAGGSDPWVLHCGIRGVLDELSSGLQGRLRLQPEEVTTTHLMVMAADMYDVAMAAVAAGGSSSAAAAAATLAAGSAGVLRVLSRALAARAEQLLPDQVLAVAALFSAPRLRDTHLLQRLTEAAASAASACTAPSAAAAAASAGPPEQRTYTAEQLLSLAQSMYSAGLRDQHMFAPLARALRARVEPRNPRDGSPGDSCTCTADVGMDARTLQSAASLLRALRLNADADVLQQAFVAQVRGRDQLPPSSAPAMQR